MMEAPAAEMPAVFAKYAASLHRRSAALLEAAEAAAAADPELVEPRARGRHGSRANMRRVATAIAAKTGADLDYITALPYTLESAIL